MTKRFSQRAKARAIAWIGLIIAIVSTSIIDGSAELFSRSAVAHLSGPLLSNLAVVAGITDESGNLDREVALKVEVVQEGGPAWMTQEFVESIDNSPHFSRASSPHIVHIEVVDDGPHLLVRLKLWRNGWEVLSGKMIEIQRSPWVAAAVLGMAGILAQSAIGAWWSLLIAGVIGEGWLVFQGAQIWNQGPVFLWLSGIQGTPTGLLDFWLILIATGLFVAAIALHFESKKKRSAISWWKLISWVSASSFGVVLWVDVAFRSTFIYACSSWPALVAELGIVMAWFSKSISRLFMNGAPR